MFYEHLHVSHPITYEIVPPRGCSINHLEPVKAIQGYLSGVTITDNPMATMRISPIVYGSYIREEFNVPIVPNLSCRDRNLLALQSELLGAHMLGFRDVFIITGDTPRKKDDFKGVWEVKSKDLCSIVKGLNNGTAKDKGNNRSIETPTDFNIGGAIVLGRPNEVDTFKSKIDSGFDFFITQITYDPLEVIDFIASLGDATHPPIQVGLAPVASAKRFKSISRMPGINISEATKRRLTDADDFESAMVSELSEMADVLKAGVDYPLGFHIMPIGSDELGCRLVKELKK
ncbi:MAG: methylenetetrahydrofolate reductase [Candidatus Bathyarchaeota archaeon]|nr:methylenetetrahydrofolate reductase [Candidatus Bathyarchaeota archaeon]